MQKADLPEDEETRLSTLQSLDILDSIEDKAYDDITKIAAQICGTPIALVSLIDQNRQWFKSHHGLSARETPRDYAFCSHAILEKQIFEVMDSRLDDRFHDNPLVTNDPHVIFYAGFPLTVNEHRMGTLCVIDDKPNALNPTQLEALEALGRQIEFLLQSRLTNKKLNERNKTLKKLSAIDPLTNIANRRTLFATLETEFKRSLRKRTPLSLILIDIDDFKKYNDHYGHLKGDACLKSVAKGLQDVLHRPGDLIARYGGEEFIYVLPDTNKAGAAKVAEFALKAIQDLKLVHVASSCAANITISIGISTTLDGEEASTNKILIDQADQALYKAKSNGKNQFQAYLQ